MPVGQPKTGGSWWTDLTECGPLEKGKANHFSCLENPMNSMKRQKNRTLKDELPRSVGAQYATGDKWRKNEGERMKEWSQSKNNIQLWMGLVIEARFDAVKSNIAQGPGMLGP